MVRKKNAEAYCSVYKIYVYVKSSKSEDKKLYKQ